MKKKKAAGIDDVSMEAQLYAGESLWKRLVELLQKVWRRDAAKLEGKYNCSII